MRSLKWDGPTQDIFLRDGRSPVPSRSDSSVGVSGGDAALPQSIQHGGRVDAQVFTDPYQGPARVVQADRVVGLAGGEAALAHVHAAAAYRMPDPAPATSTAPCVDHAGAVEPGDHGHTPGYGRGFEPANFLHPPHIPLNLWALDGQRREMLVGAPPEEQAQVEPGVGP